MVADLLVSHARPIRAHNQKQRALVPLGMRNSDCGSLRDTGASHSGVFKLDRADPLAAGLYHVLGSVRDLNGPIGMNDRNVAGIEPLAFSAGIFLLLEVAADDGRTPSLKLSGAGPVARQD